MSNKCSTHGQKRFARYLEPVPKEDGKFKCKKGKECKAIGNWKCEKCGEPNKMDSAKLTCRKCKTARGIEYEKRTVLVSNVPNALLKASGKTLRETLLQYGEVETVRELSGGRALVHFTGKKGAETCLGAKLSKGREGPMVATPVPLKSSLLQEKPEEELKAIAEKKADHKRKLRAEARKRKKVRDEAKAAKQKLKKPEKEGEKPKEDKKNKDKKDKKSKKKDTKAKKEKK